MRTKSRVEFGDFQTPLPLAREVCRLLADAGLHAASIIEPTCGHGTFMRAAAEHFPEARILGLDVNPSYVSDACSALADVPGARGTAREGDFFATDWAGLLSDLPDPLLIIGNPPWVTNAALSSLGSDNVPEKTNFQNHRGMAALTGKSNFDISEWMLLCVLDWLRGRDGVMAMLCKTSVARKLLASLWSRGETWQAAIHLIDAQASFGAAVDACLFVCRPKPSPLEATCQIFDRLGGTSSRALGFRDGRVVADVERYTRWQQLKGPSALRWRSGIKHDCSPVMELQHVGDRYRNGLGELVDLESLYLYPMLKTSELAKGTVEPIRTMLVPQTRVGDDTSAIAERAPKTWRYLQSHAAHLGKRGSRIYLNRPPFSIFGVGEYSFSPWKVAISGFYKQLAFRVVGPHRNRPIVFDDLTYFVPCRDEAHATKLASLLNAPPAQEFLDSQIFWDAKRPITIDLLSRLSLDALDSEFALS